MPELEWAGGVLAFGALAVLGVSGLVLAWDGAWTVAHTAVTGLPTVLHGRVLGWLVQAPVVLVRAFAGDPGAMALALGLATAAIPAIALAASWRIVGPDRRDLLAFPFLGIGLGLLAGQVVLISEALWVAALGWPLVLGASLGRLGRHRWLTVALVGAVAVAHPFAGPLLLVVAGIVAARAVGPWRDAEPDRRAAAGRAALAIGLAALLVVGRYLLFPSPYEAAAASIDRVLSQYRGAIAGAPLVAIAGAIGLAGWFAWRPRRDRLGLAVVLGVVGLVTVVMALWAADPARWERALMFRTFTLAIQLPIYVTAAWAARRPAPAAPSLEPVILAAVGAAMLIVFAVQAVAWNDRLGRLDAALAGTPSGCVEAAALPVAGSALDHWGLTSLVLVREGRAPGHLAVVGARCADLDASGGVPIKVVSGAVVDRAALDGWLDLRAIATGAGWSAGP